MTVQTVSRYPGVRSFQDTPIDRQLFFGRQQEQERILHTILAKDLVVIFAKSGLGKTSLLKAGVMHRLRQKDFLPIVIRFNDPSRSFQDIMYTTITSAIGEERVEYDETLSLYKNIARLNFSTTNTLNSGRVELIPVLILDQFEEFFTLHAATVREQFLPDFAELVTQRVQPLKIVVSIREDFLGYLQDIARDVPGLLQHRFRLSGLTREQAREAITQPAALIDESFSTAPFQYASGVVDAMLKFLSKQHISNLLDDTDEIEPFQLQALCQHLERNVIQADRSRDVIQEEDLGGETGMQNILKAFYTTQLRRIKPFWMRWRVNKLCEKGLINTNNRRVSLEEKDIQSRFKVSKDVLTLLVDARLLRVEPRKTGMYYELSHDNLIASIQQVLQHRYRRENVFLACILFAIGVGFWGFSQKGGTYSALGRICYVTHNYTQAGKYYRRAIQQNPRRIDYYHKLGYALYKEGSYEEALENFS